jgi:hypothetical protein
MPRQCIALNRSFDMGKTSAKVQKLGHFEKGASNFELL